MKVFTGAAIADLQLKNRFIHSATYEGMAAADGSCTEQLIETNRRIAAGGVAANIVSFSFVHDTGRSLKGQVGIHDDAMIAGLSRLAEAIKAENCKAFIQIAHAGCHADARYSHTQSMGPSAMTNKIGGEARAMSREEIHEAVGWFVAAAKRAKLAGFDGVQLHLAHGYLLLSFLSPYYNRRDDEYGGSPENRFRFIGEIIRGIREELGSSYPLLAKLNSTDGIEGGITHDLMASYACMLQDASVNAIEISGGSQVDGALWPSSRGVDPKTPAEEGYFRTVSPFFRASCTLPLIMVGGNRSLESAESMVSDGTTDFISISRPLIREPDLINRWKSGDTSRAKCISCNACKNNLFSLRVDHLYCPFAEKVRA